MLQKAASRTEVVTELITWKKKHLFSTRRHPRDPLVKSPLFTTLKIPREVILPGHAADVVVPGASSNSCPLSPLCWIEEYKEAFNSSATSKITGRNTEEIKHDSSQYMRVVIEEDRERKSVKYWVGWPTYLCWFPNSVCKAGFMQGFSPYSHKEILMNAPTKREVEAWSQLPQHFCCPMGISFSHWKIEMTITDSKLNWIRKPSIRCTLKHIC